MKELLPYVGVFALVLSIANSFYQRRKDKQGDWSKQIADAVVPFRGLPEAVNSINAELQVLKKQMEVFWRGVSFSSAQALHSPHTPELDTLLEKFQRDEIKDEIELKKLKSLLNEVIRHDDNGLRRKFAMDILTLIRVRFEIGGDMIASLRDQDIGLKTSMDNFSRRLKD